MAEISPVPEAFKRLGREVALWCNQVVKRTSNAASGKLGTVGQAAAQTDSVAATVADLRTDFNALLAKLRASGQMDT